MTAKPKKTAGLKPAQRITTKTAKKRGNYLTQVQNEGVEQLVKALFIKNGNNFCVKDYLRAIESFINKKICYGTALNFLIKAEIRVRQTQKNPAKSRKLHSKKRKGE